MHVPHLSDEELHRFGIQAHDEGMHVHPKDMPEWQESIFYDWIDAGEKLAGHCRLGLHPADNKMWLWLFLTDGNGWLAIEETQLPYSVFQDDHWTFEHAGLRFKRSVSEPLRTNTLKVSGAAQGISGNHQGKNVPIDVSLTFSAAGAAYSMGEREETGPDGKEYEAKRFEQPMMVEGTMKLGDTTHKIHGHGERDHSWGTRYWELMDWTFLILHSDKLRAQCTEVLFGENSFTLGYVQNPQMVPIYEASFNMELSGDLENPCSGSISIPLENGDKLEGNVVPLGVVPIQIAHVYATPMDSVYRRALIRWEPTDGSAPCMGWLEWCRRPSEVAD